MDSEQQSDVIVSTARQVRQSALGTAIGAALLLYFGFGYLAEPTRTGLFGWSAWVFYQTLRIGGLACAAIACWLWIGQRAALLADAVVAIAVGGLLILTGVGMWIDGGRGPQPLINVVCGGLFVSSGWRNGQEYFALLRVRVTRALHDPASGPPVRQPPAGQEIGPSDSLAARLRRRQSTPEPATPPGPSAGPVEAQVSPEPPAKDCVWGTEPPPEPPPEGYLASFAKKKPDE